MQSRVVSTGFQASAVRKNSWRVIDVRQEKRWSKNTSPWDSSGGRVHSWRSTSNEVLKGTGVQV